MKTYGTVYRGVLLSLGMLLTIGLLTARADDKIKTVEVDCTKGKTLAHALEKANEDKPVVVVVRGICNENVVIDRDDVTLQGTLREMASPGWTQLRIPSWLTGLAEWSFKT